MLPFGSTTSSPLAVRADSTSTDPLFQASQVGGLPACLPPCLALLCCCPAVRFGPFLFHLLAASLSMISTPHSRCARCVLRLLAFRQVVASLQDFKGDTLNYPKVVRSLPYSEQGSTEQYSDNYAVACGAGDADKGGSPVSERVAGPQRPWRVHVGVLVWAGPVLVPKCCLQPTCHQARPSARLSPT